MEQIEFEHLENREKTGNKNFKLLLGDCLEKMKCLSDNLIDAIVTDPPYGLKFMGKNWDYQVPSVEIFREAMRVLKPGGHLLSFGGTRTYHRMVVNIEDAGFEVRDCIQWLYGSGFPKSHNIKDGDFKGYGTALKPANEPICVARKPLEKGLTVAENVLKYGTGAINIDGSRIGNESRTQLSGKGTNSTCFGEYGKGETVTVNGRWPANIILDEAAAEMLDEQSGQSKSQGNRNGEVSNSKARSWKNTSVKGISHIDYNDSGGASRFFYVAKASKSERNAGLEGMPKKLGGAISGKETRPDRPQNHTMRENFHPTVKPIKLMQYLINLVTPPNGTVLDPFMGSGSTGVAAKILNRDFIGIELSTEYFEIAKARIKNAEGKNMENKLADEGCPDPVITEVREI